MNNLEKWKHKSIQAVKDLSGNEIKMMFILNIQEMINEIPEDQMNYLHGDYQGEFEYNTPKQIHMKHEDAIDFFPKKFTYQSTIKSLIKKDLIKRIGKYKYELNMYDFSPNDESTSVINMFAYFVKWYE